MGKLWQKNIVLDKLMEEFTVGNDYLVDQNLVVADVYGSIAHARTLEKSSLLSKEELISLEKELGKIIELTNENKFPITVEDEDCHSAIENHLVKNIGSAGKKIHTGRSRNDQVQTALRLWMREFLVKFANETLTLASSLFSFAKKHENIPMPGRTHMQLAMPSSVGLWASSYAEQLVDEATNLLNLLTIIDQSPLGSAASYGTSLPIDRTFSAKQLGFAKVQSNVLYANNSRGKFEAMVLDGCDYITLTLSKLAQDLMIFTLAELGYFTLPPSLCTGSSIMPQKRNPDGLELLRSRSAVVSSCSTRIKSIIRSLPSGYNRDFQDTKEPLFTGAKSALLVVRVSLLMIENLKVNEENLVKGFKNEIWATDEIFKRLKEGVPFRDLYREVGLNLDKVGSYDPYRAIKERTSLGTSGNLNLEGQLKVSEALILQTEDKLQNLLEVYLSLSAKATPLIN